MMVNRCLMYLLLLVSLLSVSTGALGAMNMDKAQALLGEGKIEQATQSMEEQLKSFPDDFSLNLDLGSLYFVQGKKMEARARFEKANALNPKSPLALNNLGLIELGENNVKKALEYFKRALQIDRNFVDASLNMGRVFLSSGYYDEALRTAKAAARSGEKMEKAYYLAAQAYNAKGDVDHAIDYYQKALKIAPDYLKVKVDLAFAYLLSKKEDNKAVDLFMEVLEMDETVASAHYGLGVAFYNAQEIKAAVNALKTSLYYEPKILDAYLYLGLIAAKKGNTSDAKGYFEAALDISPKYDPALYNLGMLYEKNGDVNKALKYYLKTIEANKKHSLALDRAAFFYSKKKDYQMAAKYYAEAVLYSKTKHDEDILKLRFGKVLSHIDEKKSREVLENVRDTAADKRVAEAAGEFLSSIKGE